jgi:hypothetical protein
MIPRILIGACAAIDRITARYLRAVGHSAHVKLWPYDGQLFLIGLRSRQYG